MKKIDKELNMPLVRKLTENDKEIFITMRMAYIWDSFDDVVQNQADEIEAHLRTYFDEHINKDDFVAIVCEISGVTVSIAFLIISNKPANPGFIDGRVGTIMNVYTVPEYRDKGFATMVLKEVIAEAKSRKLSLINLLATDQGYEMYKNLGFEDDEDKAMELRL